MLPRSFVHTTLLLLLTNAATGAPRPVEAPIRLSAAAVPATGNQHIDVTVARFGRYALSAKSAQGTALQLVDRMAGPGSVHGVAGESDGRVDSFLERGTYRLRTLSDRAGTGNAAIEAHGFVELSPSPPPVLPDVASTSTTLADYQQRSWWISLDADEDLAVEMAGRSLADIRVWRDGQWLDPAEPRCEAIAPDKARPLQRCEFTARLGAGLWQLVAYGGPAQAWSVNDAAQPLHVRRGAPTLAEAGRLDGVIGPFGTERWIVPGGATHYRLELPEGADASVSVRDLDLADPYRRDGATGGIKKESMPPAADVDVGRSTSGRVATVSGALGQRFTLQQFPSAGRSISVRGAGGWYFATLHAGDPADRPDVTGTLVEVRAGATPIWESLLPLAPNRPYRRKFNLLGTTTLDFTVEQDGEYQLQSADAGVKWRWEPYLITPPKGYAPPPLRQGPGMTALTRGRWVLTLEPTTPGVAEVVVRRDATQVVEPSPPRSNLTIPAIQLEQGKNYALTLNRSPDTTVGLARRTLPITLDSALPVTLAPGQTLTLPVVVPGAGVLNAGALMISVGGAFAAQHDVAEGAPIVTLRNDTAAVVEAALRFAPKESADGRLPSLPDTAVTTPPALPVLVAGTPRALDLERQASATYRMDVDSPGLYRVESTGLLATAGAIRTRTRPVLSSAAVNGTGRNFLLQTYLREGDYQVTVGAQDQSAGHLGLRLAPTPLREGGALRPEVPARASLAAGEGVTYRFDAEDGDYVLRAFGQGRVFRVRLEDADGWPLLAPEVDGDLHLNLEKGGYRLTLLPEAVATTRITLLERVPEEIRRQGHGPHTLPLDTRAAHIWWEPPAGTPRDPDVWAFELDADADVNITTNAEMTGDLYKNGTAEAVGRLVPGRVWSGRLSAGTYHLDLVNARRNSGVSYTVTVAPVQLVAGLSRMSDVPGQLPISVGARGLVELSSMGIVDVRARLHDAAGVVVGASDDRPEDWNFRIAERLPAGEYTLKIEPVGVANGQVRVHMGAMPESDAKALGLGEARQLTPGSGVIRLPLNVGKDGVLVASAESAENIEIAVERQEAGIWRTLASGTGSRPRVVVRLANGTWRLRLTSLDGRGVPATVRTDVVIPRNISESALATGVSVQAERGLAIAQVRRSQPGLLELASRVGVSWCPTAGAECVEAPASVLAAPDAEVWLVAETSAKVAILRATRVVLDRGSVRAVLPAGRRARLDVAASPGPVLVTAHAEGGQPGLHLGVSGDIAWHDAFAVSITGGSPAELYGAPGSGDLAVDLHRVGFGAPELGTVSGGRASGALAAGGAWAGELGAPAGAVVPVEPNKRTARPVPTIPVSAGRRVVLSLGEGLVAAIVHAGAIVSVHAAADGPRVETIEGPADRLIVLNPTSKAVPWSVNVLPLGGAPATLSGGPLERIAPAAGRTRVAVPAGTRGVLHLGGAATAATFVGLDGAIATSGRALAGAGSLTVTHGAGPWIAWVEEGEETTARGLWPGPAPAPGAVVSLPATPPLDQPVVTLRMVAPGPGMMRLAAGQPVVALLRRGTEHARAVLAIDGVVTWRVASGETWDLAIRPVGGGALRGQAELTHVPAVILEGVGQSVVVAPGEARAWSFTVPKDGPVGFGVRTDSRDLTLTLLDAAGAELGRGLAQMPLLKAGTYLLVATLPAMSTPATVRPAVVGLLPPDTGPPEDIIRSYLVEAGVLQ